MKMHTFTNLCIDVNGISLNIIFENALIFGIILTIIIIMETGKGKYAKNH